MGRICIVLLVVAFACRAYGFKAEVNGIDSETNELKVPYMTEQQPMDTENAPEEPEESDVDGDLSFNDDEEQEEPIEDEEDDEEKAANEKRVEDEFEAELSRMENAERKRLGDQDGEAMPIKRTGEKSLGWWGRRSRRTVVHKHKYHYRYVYKYSLKCKSGSWVGGHMHSGKPIYKTIYFRPYFQRTPAVVTGVQWLNSHSHYHNVRFGVKVVAKNRTYMRIKVWTWGYHNGVHKLYVNWMACPQ